MGVGGERIVPKTTIKHSLPVLFLGAVLAPVVVVHEPHPFTLVRGIVSVAYSRQVYIEWLEATVLSIYLRRRGHLCVHPTYFPA